MMEYERWQRARIARGCERSSFTLEEWEEMERELEKIPV